MEKKVEFFIEEMAKEHGIHPSFSYPMFFRVLARIGLSLRPPIFGSFIANVFTWAMPLAVTCGILMYLSDRIRQQEVQTYTIVFFSISTGIIYGLIQAVSYTNKAKQLNLPAWEKYNPPEEV